MKLSEKTFAWVLINFSVLKPNDIILFLMEKF